jgi:hypothetical protein
MRKSLAAIARSAICPPFARRSEQSTAPSTLRPDAPDGRGVRAPLPAGVASMHAEMQNHGADAQVDPDPGATVNWRVLPRGCSVGITVAVRDVPLAGRAARSPRKRSCPQAAHLVTVRVAQQWPVGRTSGRSSSSCCPQRWEARPGCTAWSLALLGAIDTSSRSRSVPPCRGGAFRPWRHFEAREPWNRPGMRRPRRWRWFGAPASCPVSGAFPRSEN